MSFSGTDPSVFCLAMMSEAHGFVNDKMFLYESTKLEDLLVKLTEKVPANAFIQELDFTGVLSVRWG